LKAEIKNEVMQKLRKTELKLTGGLKPMETRMEPRIQISPVASVRRRDNLPRIVLRKAQSRVVPRMTRTSFLIPTELSPRMVKLKSIPNK